jgi:hypothetical protein
VQQIEKGKQVIIGVPGRQPLNYTLLAADADGVVVVKPTDKKLDEDLIDALVQIGAGWPDVLAGRPVTKGGFEIKGGGVYRKGTKLMDLAAVVERIDRTAVIEVRGLHTKSAGDPSVNAVKQQAVKGGIIGGVIGFAAIAVVGFADPYCIRPCNNGQEVMAKAAIGAGIGGLIGGLRGQAVGAEHATFYVAPNGPMATLDDVPWERLRLALPPSLQGAGAAQKPKTAVRPIPVPSASAKGSPWSVTF